MRMAYKFSNTSILRLNTCDSKIIFLMNYALASSPVDFLIACGYRGQKEQEEAYKKGTSNAKFGQSKHNVCPSKAVDIYPYVNGRMCNGDLKEDYTHINILKDHILKCATEVGTQIVWGGHFKKLKDYPHFELL